MEEVDLNITGLFITEQSETKYILFLVAPNDMYVQLINERLGDYVQVVFNEQTENDYAAINLYLLDSKESVRLRIDKNTHNKQYIEWLRNRKVTHLGVCYHRDGKDIPLLRVRPLSW